MAIELEYPHIEAASAHGTPARLRRVPRVGGTRHARIERGLAAS